MTPICKSVPTPVHLHSARAALLVAALVLFALIAPARADEVQTDLTGKVLSVALSPGAPAGLADALDGHGVKVGASASVSFRVESTTPPGTGVSPDYTYYYTGITSMTIQIGSYTAMLFLPTGFETLNLVQVGDNVPGGGQVSDSVIMSTPGMDTDRLLHGLNPGWPTLNVSAFDFSGANASKDDGIVQDFEKYDFGNAVIGGAYGSINITLDLGKGGGGGKDIGPGFCRKVQMLAAGKFGRKLLLCGAKSAQQPPQKDPGGEKLQICIEKAAELFEKQFSKGVFKSMKKGSMCTLSSLGAETVTVDLQAAVDAIIGPVLTGVNPEEKKDRALRGKLLRAAAGQWVKDSAAYARDAFKPSAQKLVKKLDNSRSRTESRVAKALMAAQKQGIAYSGPDGPALADAVRSAVEDYLSVTGGTPTPD